jgi:hypothetical protein
MQKMQFNMEQLAGGKEYWIAKLTQSLNAKSEKEVEAS